METAEGDSVPSASDSWRLHNPDEQVFTHHSHLGSASRIDRMYSPRTLRNCVLNTDIKPCTHSDHDTVSVFLTLGKPPVGGVSGIFAQEGFL